MSHVGIRILANRLAHLTEGVNTIAPTVPRLDGDTAPPSVTVYDSTRNDWLARGQIPRPTPAPDATYPGVLVSLQRVDYDTGAPDVNAEGSRTINGTLTALVQLVLNNSDTGQAAADGMYLLRAIRGVLVVLDDGRNQDARTAAYTQLGPSTSVMQAQSDAPVPDTLVAPGAFVVTYPFKETVPLTIDL